MRLGVRALRRQPVRQPHLRLRAVEKRRRHALSARRGDHDDRRPWRSRTSTATRSCPSRARSSRRWRSPRSRARSAAIARLARRTACRRARACWRSRPARSSGRTGRRAASVRRLKLDHLAAVQIRDRRRDAGAERRAFGHVGGRRRGDARLAARARGAEQIDARRDRLDRRQVDMIVGARELLVRPRRAPCRTRSARRAMLRVDVGVLGELARDAGAAFARRLRRRRSTLAFCPRDGGSEELSGVFGGVPSLASSSAMRASSALFCASSSSIRPSSDAFCATMRQHQRLQVVIERIDLLGRHAELESARARRAQRQHARVTPPQRGE